MKTMLLAISPVLILFAMMPAGATGEDGFVTVEQITHGPENHFFGFIGYRSPGFVYHCV